MSEPVIAIEISGQVISFAQESLVLAAITALLGAMLGWLITYMLQQKRMTRMQTRLRMEQYATQRALEDMEQRFANLSTEALQKNHQAFINLAMENLENFSAVPKPACNSANNRLRTWSSRFAMHWTRLNDRFY